MRVETQASGIIRATDILLKRFNDRPSWLTVGSSGGVSTPWMTNGELLPTNAWIFLTVCADGAAFFAGQRSVPGVAGADGICIRPPRAYPPALACLQDCGCVPLQSETTLAAGADNASGTHHPV